jgi:hypothetical protein
MAKRLKTMKEVSKGFEAFMKKRKKKPSSKASFDKLLTKVAKQVSSK